MVSVGEVVGLVVGWLVSAFAVWLHALRKLQGVGWLGALWLAILIWIINGILGLILPHLKL